MNYFADIKEFSAWIVGIISMLILLYTVYRKGDKLKG